MRMKPVEMPPEPGPALFYGIIAVSSIITFALGYGFFMPKKPTTTAAIACFALPLAFMASKWLHGVLIENYYSKRHENTDRAAINNDNTPADELARIHERRQDREEFRFAILSHPNWKAKA